MANPHGTSFIPQRPTKGKMGARNVRKIYVLAYISYIFFFGSVLAAGGTIFYQYTVEAQLESQKQQLAQERDRFSQADIESVRQLENRLMLAQNRMNDHVSLVSIFEALERSTVQALRFTTFSYQRLDNEAPLVALTGTTGEFDSVLFQQEILGASPIFADSTISEIGLKSVGVGEETDGRTEQVITFTLEKSVEPSLIGYQPRFAATPEDAASSEQIDENSAENTDDQQNAASTTLESVPDDAAEAPETGETTQTDEATDTNEI